MNAALRIGIIGLGAAGGAAARRLLSTAPPELSLTVFDKVPAQCEPLRGAATLAASAQEVLRESDLIVLALPGPREIDRTLERFSDGKVGADIRGKLLWNLRALPAAAAAGLDLAVRAAGAAYIAGGADEAARTLPPGFDTADARKALLAMGAT